MAITTVSSHVVSVNAIQGTLIADNAITAVHIATNAVSGTLIADNAVTATHIAQNTITVTQIADDAITAPKLADGIITTNHLNSAMISSQTEVTAVAGDFLLIGDTSDSNNLKKTPISDIVALAGVAGISSSADATAITIGSDEGVTFAAGITSTAAANTLGATSFSEADLTNVGTIYADQYLGDADTDSGIVLPGSNVMTLHTNNAERMRFDSAGRVAIGVTNPADYYATNLVVQGASEGGITIASTSTQVWNYIMFADGTSGDARYRGYFGYNHNNDSLAIAAGGTQRLRVDSDGLKFGSDSATANALDDYEEGTWTPTINVGTLDGNQVGTYTKVGRKVTLQFYINVTTLGSSGSGILVQSLPFTSANITSGHVAGSVVGRYFTLNDLNLLIPPNQAYIQFWNNGSGDFDQVTFGEVEPSYDADFSCYGTITYFAA